MGSYQPKRHIKILWVVILFGVAYSSFLYSQHSITGMNELDGAIGVLLGLYICSHPAANVIDKLFFGRGARHLFSSRKSAVMWLIENAVILLLGWIFIFIGTTRFFGKMD